MEAYSQVQFLNKVIVWFTGAVVQTMLSVWEDPQLQLFFRDIDFPVVALRLSHGPAFSAVPRDSPAVHLAVDVPVVQLQRSSLCCHSDKFQLLVLTAGMRG